MTEMENYLPKKSVSQDVVEAVNLLAQGKRNMMCGEMSHAVAQLQEACRILGAEYGELADECADAYFCYGKALLEVSRMESGVLGDAIPGDSEEDSQDSDDDDDDVEETVDQSSNVDGENSGEGTENDSVASEDIENEEADVTTDGDAAVSNEVSTEGNIAAVTSDATPSTSSGIGANKPDGTSSKPEVADDVSSLQLAWEMLELAKLIYKRNNAAEMRLKLADTHLKLGEIGLETEQYDQAISDLSECLDIQQSILSSDDRCLAETLYQLGLACTFDKRYDDAIKHYRSAIDVLEQKIAQLRRIISGETVSNPNVVAAGSFESPAELAQKEIDELMSILPDLLAKIDDIDDERRSAPQVQTMMKEAVVPTSDSMARFGNCDSGFASSSSSSSTSTAFQSFSDAAAVSSLPIVHNITHLVRKKRKSDIEDTNIDATKKSKVSLGNEDSPLENGLKSVDAKNLNGDSDGVSAVETVKSLQES